MRKKITKKLHVTMNREPLQHVSAIIYSHRQGAQIYIQYIQMYINSQFVLVYIDSP